MFRYFLFLLGVILALPILAIISLALGLPVTISGIGYLLGCALAAAGLILAPWAGRTFHVDNNRWHRGPGFGCRLRLIFAWQETTPNIRMIALPQNRDTRWINTLVDEQDSLIVGEALFHLIGGNLRQ